MIKYLKNSFYELKHNVSWTKRQEAQNLVVVVFSFTILFSLLIWAIDSSFSNIISKYFELIN